MKTHLYFFPLNLFTTTISIFLINVIVTTSSVCAYPYDECLSPFSCGNISNIGYPFSGNGRPWYCGFEAFQLQCPDPNGYPVLQIKHYLHGDHDLYFHVSNISIVHKNTGNISQSYITTKLLHNSSSVCPSDFSKNFVFENFLISTSKVSVMRLYDNCHNDAILASKFVYCSDVKNHQQYQYSYGPDNKHYRGCDSYDVLVFKEELHKFLQGDETLKNVLNKGFELDFDISLCTKCEKSGGVCGSSKEKLFVCYCKDNPQPQSEACWKPCNN